MLWLKGFDVRKLYEIARYLDIVPINIEYLVSLGNRYDVGEYVCYCVHYANLLFPNHSLNAVENLLKSEQGAILYDCYGLCDEERKQWNVPFENRLKNTRSILEPLLTERDRKKIEENMKMM